MFTGARFLIGFGTAISGNAAPTLIVEISHPKQRGTVTGVSKFIVIPAKCIYLASRQMTDSQFSTLRFTTPHGTWDLSLPPGLPLVLSISPTNGVGEFLPFFKVFSLSSRSSSSSLSLNLLDGWFPERERKKPFRFWPTFTVTVIPTMNSSSLNTAKSSRPSVLSKLLLTVHGLIFSILVSCLVSVLVYYKSQIFNSRDLF
jgi:hypothetical protein